MCLPLPRVRHGLVRLNSPCALAYEVKSQGREFPIVFQLAGAVPGGFSAYHVPTVLRRSAAGSLLGDGRCIVRVPRGNRIGQRGLVRMTLGELGEHRVTMHLNMCECGNEEVIVAARKQTTASMTRNGAGLVAAGPGALA